MSVMDEAPTVDPGSRSEWRAWLAANYARPTGVWLVQWKRHTGHLTVAYEDAVEEALCFGWIDGRFRPLDADRTVQWFSPRRPKSTWAKTNKERVERLEAAGLMTDAGRAVIEIAKANGSWTSLDHVEAMVMPPDLEAALAEHEGAREHFESRSPSQRQMAFAVVNSVKRADLRAAKIGRVVEVCIARGPLTDAFVARRD